MAAIVESGKAKTWYPGWKNAFETQPLTTVGGLVTIVDQYSADFDVPLDKDAAAKAKDGMRKYLAAPASHGGGRQK